MHLKTTLIGAGPTRVIALHDWTSTAQTYDACLPLLDTERFTYAFAEIRGYGRGKEQRGQYTAQEVCADIIDTADALGWSQFALIGHSMTAMPCQIVAKTAPERVTALVLVTPVPADCVPVDRAGREMFRSAATDDTAALSIMRMLTGGRLPERFLRRKLRTLRADIDAGAFDGYLAMWTSENHASAIGSLNARTRVILGGHDFEFFAEPNMRQRIGATIAAADYVVVESAAHYPMAETPLRFVRLVEDFLGPVVAPPLAA